MPESSYWKFCYFAPDGEEICTELYALPDSVDGEIRDQVNALAVVDAVAGQQNDAVVQIRLVEVLDEAAGRLNARLPDGFALRRSELARFGGDAVGFVGVPGVIGLTHVDAYNTLRAAGYQVKTVWEWTSSSPENTVTGQSPAAGAGNYPPTVVYIDVRTLPPDPTEFPDPEFLPG